MKGISWGQNLRVSDRAFAVTAEQGGVIEEPVEPSSLGDDEVSASGSTGGEPSSFAEKVFVPGPEPVVGSITTVDLARKEGFNEDTSSTSDSDESLV